MKYVLDTNVVSEPIRARPSGAVLAGIEAHTTELAISAISWQEMHYGFERLPPGARTCTSGKDWAHAILRRLPDRGHRRR
ncbi:PIN domain-containing protein [Thiocapsa sp.]|uniref:PIN domain-containing protein n=1 Tax=Thiocapsa sp. TaxID=2024551 RepID=UPI003457FB67